MLLLHSTPLALKTSVRKSIGSQYLVLQGNRSINIIFYINIIKHKYYFMINYRMKTTESIHYFISMFFKFFRTRKSKAELEKSTTRVDLQPIS